jgi:type IV pilus assembly protein PilB
VAGRTRFIDQLLTTVMSLFRPLIRLFKKPMGEPPPRAGETKLAVEEKASGGRRIGQVLVDLGFLADDQLSEVLDEAKGAGQPTGQVAISRGLITEEQLLQALAEQHGLMLVDLEETKPQEEAVAIVPQTMATVYKVLPLALEDNVLTVAIGDPNSSRALDDLRNFLGVKEVQPVLAPPKTIAAATAKAYAGKEESILDIIHRLEEDESFGSKVGRPAETSIDLDSLMEIQDAAPVRKLLNMVMLLAIKDRASDVHFEPFEDEYKMRYRADGVLYELVPPPRHLAAAISTRIKVMANLDIAEMRLPQHGRIELNVGGLPVDMLVSVLPTMFGEHVVIRVLDPMIVSFDLNKVGMDPETLRQFRHLIREPSGMILVAGPTGAGKTTTLYSALSELNEITGKIITAEDPVEYSNLDGIVRCQIRHDLGFAKALPSILGQDPDVIVVGEIRDQETAQVAVQAALRGPKVLSTLDANDAASSITRLRGLGLEPSSIATTVKAILAQRLVRKICEDCRTECEPSPEMLMDLNLRPEDARGKKFYFGRGCRRCNNTGHRGRSGIFELATMNDDVRDAISAGASTEQLRARCWAQGMTTLREAGLKALHNGVTTIEELARETFRVL